MIQCTYSYGKNNNKRPRTTNTLNRQFLSLLFNFGTMNIVTIIINNNYIDNKIIMPVLYDSCKRKDSLYTMLKVDLHVWVYVCAQLFNPYSITAMGEERHNYFRHSGLTDRLHPFYSSLSDWSIWSPDTRGLQDLCHTIWRVKITHAFTSTYTLSIQSIAVWIIPRKVDASSIWESKWLHTTEIHNKCVNMIRIKVRLWAWP